VLQCVAVCCSVLLCVAVCCSVLQCIAVCCSVLQCVAVCCSVLQCIAVCCSVLHRVARIFAASCTGGNSVVFVHPQFNSADFSACELVTSGLLRCIVFLNSEFSCVVFWTIQKDYTDVYLFDLV